MSTVPERLSAALADRYALERELGEGGMATVYLAHDVKHDRRVAIKVLRPELAAVIGAERFLAEIKTTANLQHPHILPLFDSGEADGFLWYAMPHVEGESLRDRLDREKQLPVDEAVGLAVKVAGALQAAHEMGVIHRDIKPANVLVDRRGEPLVADFGIALAVQHAGGRLTETGLSVGTPYYMSPEQATADRALDARSDVYSLACVLYEMLAGDPPHVASTAQAVLAKILTEEAPGVGTRRRSVPPNVETALAKGLERLPADRFATAAEFAGALSDPAYRNPSSTAQVAQGRATPLMPWGVATLAMVAAALGWLTGGGSGSAASDGVLRVVPVESSVQGGRTYSLSPDGRRLTYVCDRDGSTAVCLMDLSTEGGERVLSEEEGSTPEFSPDGRRVAFFSRLKVRVVSVETGAEQVIADHSGIPWPMAWVRGDSIAFVNDRLGVLLVSSTGGEVRSLIPADEPYRVRGLRPLPEGNRILVQARDPLTTQGQRSWIGVFDLDGGGLTEVVEGGVPLFVPPGYLTFENEGHRVIRFDPETGETRGEAVEAPVLPLSVSGDGLAVRYRTGRGPTLVRLAQVSPSGEIGPVFGAPDVYFDPRVSPSGDRVAVVAPGGGDASEEGVIVVMPLDGGRELRLADGGEPQWGPDGDWIYYTYGNTIRRTPADGSAGDQLVAEVEGRPSLGGVTRDGRVLARLNVHAEGQQDRLSWIREGVEDTIVTLPGAVPILRASPDGAWIAYVTYGVGVRRGLDVRRSSDGATVSLTGLYYPTFSRDSRTMWAIGQDAQGREGLTRVPLLPDGTVGDPEPVRPLPPGVSLRTSWPWQINYDVLPGDRGFLFRVREEGEEPTATRSGLFLVMNLPQALERALRSGGEP